MKSPVRKSLFNPRFCALLCLQAYTLGSAALWAQGPTPATWTTYSVTNICTPLAYSAGADINDKGQMVGTASAADGSVRPFLWQNGHFTALPAGMTPVRINNNGQVLLNKYTGVHADVFSGSFVWQNGKLTDLGLFGGFTVPGTDINDKGQVVGYNGAGAFLWQNGTVTKLSVSGSTVPIVAATGINQGGDIAAETLDMNYQQIAALLKNGKITDVGSGPGVRSTTAGRINAKDQLIGRLESYIFRRAFVGQNGTTTDLGTLGGEAGKPTCPPTAFPECISYPNAVNNAGQVVGVSDVPGSTSTDTHAVLWQNGRIMDLNNLIPAESGWVLVEASGINSQGQIVGRGYNTARPGCTFLLTPTHTVDATLHLSSESWRFAAHVIGQASGPGTIWIYNSGPAATNFNSIQFTGADPHDFAITGNTCGSLLAPFTTCKVVFHFKPTAAGERTASLNLNENAQDGPHAIPVQGFGSSK